LSTQPRRAPSACWLAARSRRVKMKRNLLAIALLAITLAGCVVVPGRPMYVRATPVVIY
jgi:PhoPQ-activated pathogenicity-related protein